jgi:hypothetical protein
MLTFWNKFFLKILELKKKHPNINQKIILSFKDKNEVLRSLSKNYKDSYIDQKFLNKYKKNFNDFRVIGMGGSTLRNSNYLSIFTMKK